MSWPGTERRGGASRNRRDLETNWQLLVSDVSD